MRTLITLTLFILTLLTVRTAGKESPQHTATYSPETVLPAEEYDTQLISCALLNGCTLSTGFIHEGHTLFKHSCQRFLHHIQLSIRKNAQQTAKAAVRLAGNLTVVSSSLHKQGHPFESRRQKKPYNYIIRHILI